MLVAEVLAASFDMGAQFVDQMQPHHKTAAHLMHFLMISLTQFWDALLLAVTSHDGTQQITVTTKSTKLQLPNFFLMCTSQFCWKSTD